ncbi:MAG: ATP-binding protein [Candidatus Dormiibacterota bacterium]
MSLRATDVDEVVEAAMLSLPPAAGEITVDVSPDLPEVAADAGLLERALANILANARAWSPPDAPVRITAGAIGERVEIRVVDSGPGIPEVRREEAFQPFQRLGDRNGNHPGGLGLGLAIARGFVEAMGGEVGVEDTPGGGATLVVSLPGAPG